MNEPSLYSEFRLGKIFILFFIETDGNTNRFSKGSSPRENQPSTSSMLVEMKQVNLQANDIYKGS